MSPRHDMDSGRPSGWSITGRTATTRPLAGAVAQLRPLARRVHFLAGILVAPFLLVLCMTGLVYVCSPQIHEDLYGGQLFVPAIGDSPRPVAEQIATALAAHPEAELRSVVPPPAPDRTTRVNLAVPSLTEPGEARTVFVDPHTNYISGELTTVDGRMPANVWLRDLHADLHLGAVGRLYSEVAASWLPVIVVGGLLLWIAKQGRRRRGIRELLTPLPRGKGEQARMRAVHGPLGIWLTAGLLVMSVTGLTMSRFAGWGLPAVRIPELAGTPVPVPRGVQPASVDRVLQVARAEGLTGELRVAAPTAPDQPFTVAEISPGLPIRKSSIAVDPYTAQVTERIGWNDYPFLAQLREIGQQAHTGTLFGVANQIVLGLLVIATIVLILIGYRMWWKRSPYGERLASVPPPALRQLTASVGVPVVLVTVVLAWLMPAFGLSLAAFVVLDLVINAVRQRQERLRRAVTAGALLVAVAALGVAVVMNTPSPVTRVDAVEALPDRRVPEPAPLYEPPPPVDQAVPDQVVPDQAAPNAVGEDVVAAPPRSIQGAPARPAPAPPARDADAPADRPGDTELGRSETGSSGTRGSGGGGSDDARDASPADPSEAPDQPGNPPDDPPAPAPPPAQDPPADSPGLVGGLVGNLVDTVKSISGGLLGG